MKKKKKKHENYVLPITVFGNFSSKNKNKKLQEMKNGFSLHETATITSDYLLRSSSIS